MSMRYMTAKEAAMTWRVHESRVRQWCQDKRVPGARKMGRDWLIPIAALRPYRAKPGELKWFKAANKVSTR